MKSTNYFGYKVFADGSVLGKRGTKLRQYTKKTVTMGYKYISIMVEGKCLQKSVHSVVYEAFVGAIPKGMHVDHIDDNPTNNDISNLQVLTPRQNTRKSGNKITESQASEIRRRRQLGESGVSLSKEFGISPQQVCGIFKSRRWQVN